MLGDAWSLVQSAGRTADFAGQLRKYLNAEVWSGRYKQSRANGKNVKRQLISARELFLSQDTKDNSRIKHIMRKRAIAAPLCNILSQANKLSSHANLAAWVTPSTTHRRNTARKLRYEPISWIAETNLLGIMFMKADAQDSMSIITTSEREYQCSPSSIRGLVFCLSWGCIAAKEKPSCQHDNVPLYCGPCSWAFFHNLKVFFAHTALR